MGRIQKNFLGDPTQLKISQIQKEALIKEIEFIKQQNFYADLYFYIIGSVIIAVILGFIIYKKRMKFIKIVKMIYKKIRQYLPDTLIVVGIAVLSYCILTPKSWLGSWMTAETYGRSVTFGISLIAIGAVMAIRRCFNHKNK